MGLANVLAFRRQLGQVEPYQQSTKYNCAAATSHAVLKHWGLNISEARLARLIGVDPERGANSTQVIEAIHKLGLDAEVRGFQSIDELKALTDQDVPVIANVVSFTRPPDGHFVVVTDVGRTVTLMDPNTPSNRRVLSRAAFDARWRPRGRTGVVIRRRRPQRQRAALGELGHEPALHQQGWFWALSVAAIGLGVGFGVQLFAHMKHPHYMRRPHEVP